MTGTGVVVEAELVSTNVRSGVWDVQVIEDYPSRLAEFLNERHQEGWEIKSIGPNGVNRYTIVMFRPEA